MFLFIVLAVLLLLVLGGYKFYQVGPFLLGKQIKSKKLTRMLSVWSAARAKVKYLLSRVCLGDWLPRNLKSDWKVIFFLCHALGPAADKLYPSAHPRPCIRSTLRLYPPAFATSFFPSLNCSLPLSFPSPFLKFLPKSFLLSFVPPFLLSVFLCLPRWVFLLSFIAPTFQSWRSRSRSWGTTTSRRKRIFQSLLSYLSPTTKRWWHWCTLTLILLFKTMHGCKVILILIK